MKFAVHKSFVMLMDYEKRMRRIPTCLVCGDKIRYGRTDKKFCCDDCRMKYNNNIHKEVRTYRRKVMSMLARNYEILSGLVRTGLDSADLQDLELKGFYPGIVTSYRRIGKHDVFCCFDIKYIMTRTRIYSVMKIKNFQ